MRRSFAQLLALAFVAAAPVLVPNTASAGLEACGNMDLTSSARCEVLVEGGCEAQCEPVSFTASCAADLSVKCDGGCNAEVDVSCTASCQGTCEAECEVDPGRFDCSASCKLDCNANCDGACAASANKAECRASCEATCSGDCNARCDISAPEADCKAQCQGCCTGSCEAKANLSCQIDCQAEGYAECKADLQGGCEVQCREPEGALFCDGQFVEASNVDTCAAAIEAALNIEVEGNAECDGTTCSAEGSISTGSCAAAPAGHAPFNAAALAALAAGVGLIATRRKRG